MKTVIKGAVLTAIASIIVSAPLLAFSAESNLSCRAAGPQSPRHLDSVFAGNNSTVFETADDRSDMNLCNMHFHNSAEHRSFGFIRKAQYSGGKGWQCSSTHFMTAQQLRPFKYDGTNVGGGSCEKVVPGSTVEVHWVFTSCPVAKPSGGGLADACAPSTCENPVLRVESQVFSLVNHDILATDDPSNSGDLNAKVIVGVRPNAPSGLGEIESFQAYGSVIKANKRFQPEQLPDGPSVAYLGSTTGPKYNSTTTCSPNDVSWNVRTGCRTLDIRTFHNWCRDTKFFKGEDGKVEAHGIRALVENPKYLSKILHSN